jgi:rhamnosyltransferase subunit B
MGRRILLAWELGGGDGHRLKLNWLASALRDRGHEVHMVVPAAASGDVAIQGPLWPGMLDPQRIRNHPTATGQVDILAAYGLAEPGVFGRLLHEWHSIFRTLKPDLVVAETAPACLTAARGRLPTLAIGNGYSLPPIELDKFPNFRPDRPPPIISEQSLLEAVNGALTEVSGTPLQTLPQIYGADRTCVGMFSELDPYAASRKQPLAAPWLPEWEGGAEMRREEVFCYFSIATRRLETIIEALGRAAFAGVPVSIYIPRPRPGISVLLASTKIRVEPKPLSLSEIQSRARMIMSFGSLGLVSFALAAGIPQIIIPLSMPNRMTGKAVEALGTGMSIRLKTGNPIEPALLAQVIQQRYVDAELTARAIARAPDFIGRAFPRAAEVAASMAEELL